MKTGFSQLTFLLLVAIWLVAPSFVWAQSQLPDREWPHETKVDIFQFHSDFELNDRERIEQILGHLRQDISESLKLAPQQSMIHVVLFSNAKEYSRYMHHYFPSIVPRRAIYLQDRGPGMLFTYWHDDIDIDLRHEAVHAVLNQSGVQLPLWLDEGLAEYFEIPKERRYAHNAYILDTVGRTSTGIVPSLMQLEKLTNMAEFSEADYRDSWAWVHFLLHRREETQQLLIDYLNRHRKRSPQPLLSRQLAEIMSDPTAEFQDHFAKISSKGSPQSVPVKPSP